ncbi:MAG: cytochrome c [Acidobacteria bacterium]|nr:cytochrome c [Acidobacteriota bacterium]
MRHFKLFVLASAAALFAVACATNTNTNTATGPGRTVTVNTNNANAAPPAATPDELAAARATYNTTCAKCHKENGEGGVAELDEGEKLKVPSFKEEHSVKHTEADFVRKITNGDKDEGMPAFKGRLTPEQINDLARFVRREFQSAGATTTPANANAGTH